VAATRALVRFLEDPAAPEVQDVLRIVQLIAAKDSWSAAVLVDAGALDLVQALMNTTKVAAPAAPAAAPSATSSAAATPSRSRAQRVSTPTASPILGADDTKLARELIKVLLRVPPEQLRSLATPVVAPSRGNNKSVASPGRKIGSPVRGGSKAPDAPMLSSASSSSSSFSSSSFIPPATHATACTTTTTSTTTNHLLGGRGGWCFPRIDLSRADEEILFRAKAELASGDVLRQLGMTRQLASVLFRDYPAEVFLQRPECFRMLLTLLKATKAQTAMPTPPEDAVVQLFEAIIDALQTLLNGFRSSLKMQLDCELKPSAQEGSALVTMNAASAAASSASNATATPANVYPSFHGGSIVRAASAKSVTPTISLGDAALMVAAGALPNGGSAKVFHGKLMPLFRSALCLLSEPFPVYHALLTGKVFDHQSLTASRFERLLQEVDADAWSASASPEHFSSVLEAVFLEIFGDDLTAPSSDGGDEQGNASVPSYTKIRIVAQHEQNQAQAQDDKEISHQVRVPRAVSQFVHHVLFHNAYSGDEQNSTAHNKRRRVLLYVLEHTDSSGFALLKQATRIAASVQSTTALFRNDAFASAAAAVSADLIVVNNDNNKTSASDHDFLRFVTASLTQRQGTVAHTRGIVGPRIARLETAVVALLSAEEEMPAAMVSEACGQIIAVCAIASRCFTSLADAHLRERCFCLLARLLAFPVLRVQQAAYEHLLGVITTHELNGIGFASIELSRAHIDQHIMAGVLLDPTIFGIVLVRGVASSNLETRACAVGIAHQLESLTIKQRMPARVLQPFMPLLDVLPATEAGRPRTHSHSVVLHERLDVRARVLLGLQRLGSKDPAMRIEAARYLRAQADVDGVGPSVSSPALVASRMREIEIEADPRMLRDPLMYTSNDFSSAAQTRHSVAEDFQSVNLAFAGISPLRSSAGCAVSYSREDAHRLGSLLKSAPRSSAVDALLRSGGGGDAEDGGVDASIWCSAAVHLTAMLVQGSKTLAKQCGAHSKGKDNILLRIFESVFASGVMRQGNGWQVRAVALDLCVTLVGSCTACWSACSELECLLSCVLPCVFHAESAVRLRAIRLALLITFHPCRMVDFLCSANRLDLDGLPMLVGADNIPSYSQTSDEHSSVVPASVAPVLYLPSFVLEACNVEIVGALVNLVQHSFPEAHSFRDSDAEAVVMTSEQRQDVVMHLKTSSSETGSSPAARVRVLLSSIQMSQTHEQFIEATEHLRACCSSDVALHLALTAPDSEESSSTLWWSVFQRFLVNAPTCAQDDRALCSVLRLLRSLVTTRQDKSGRTACAMSTGGIVALVTTLKRNLFSIVQSAQNTSTSYGRRGADSGRLHPRSTVLAVGTDYYASPTAMAFTDPHSRLASENLRIDLSVAVFRLVSELYAACASSASPMSPIARDAIASIGLETNMLETLAFGYIGNKQMRLDARYFAAQVATGIALPVLETQCTGALPSNAPMTKGMRSLFVACLDVLHDAEFADFRGKTLVRSAVTFVASVCASSEGIALMSGVLFEKLPTSFGWCARAVNDRETLVSAAGHEISCTVSALGAVQRLQVQMQQNTTDSDVSSEPMDNVPAGIVHAFKTALQTSKALLVRAAALNSIANTMEGLTELGETKFDGDAGLDVATRTSDWLCAQLAVTSHALLDAAASSPRLLLATVQLVSFLLLGMGDAYYAAAASGVEQLAICTKRLWETELSNGSSNITHCWETSIRPLLSHAYVPDAFAVDARSVTPPSDVIAFVNERTTSFAVAVSSASADGASSVQYGRTSFSRLVTDLAHELWYECHVPVVHQGRAMNMFLVHNIPLPRCRPRENESKDDVREDEQEQDEKEVTVGSGGDDRRQASAAESVNVRDVSLCAGEAALETLQASWRVFDAGHGDKMYPSLMIEMASQLLASVLFVDNTDGAKELPPRWWQPTEVLNLAARGAAFFDNDSDDMHTDVSARCCFLLWCLLEKPRWCPPKAAKSLAAVSCSFGTTIDNGCASSGTQSLISALTCTLMSKYFAMYGDALEPPVSLLGKDPPYLHVLESLLKIYPDAQKSACEAGGVYFALTQLSNVHDTLMRIDLDEGLEKLRHKVASAHNLGQLATLQSDPVLDAQGKTLSRCMSCLSVHFRFLESILRASAEARAQALQLGAGEVFQRTWSLLRSVQYGKKMAGCGSGSLLCAFLRMLAGMVNGSGNSSGSDTAGGLMPLNRAVFGIPKKGVQMFAIGGRSEIKPFSRTDGASLSLLAKLVQLVTVGMANAVPTSVPAVASLPVPQPPAACDDGDLNIVQLGCLIISSLAQQDLQASRVLSRTPLVQNLTSLLNRSIDALPKALSYQAMSKMRPSQVERKTRTIEMLSLRQVALRHCILEVMLSVSLHRSEHACFFFDSSPSSSRDTGKDFISVASKLLSEPATSSDATSQRQLQAGVLMHVLRNLALRSENKARFLTHPDMLLRLLSIFGSGSSRGNATTLPGHCPPFLVACSAACLWALVFNNKRIVPMLKELHAGKMCSRALKMLKGHYAGRQQYGAYEGALVLHVLTVLPKLRTWL
jgi:hypothetical protein